MPRAIGLSESREVDVTAGYGADLTSVGHWCWAGFPAPPTLNYFEEVHIRQRRRWSSIVIALLVMMALMVIGGIIDTAGLPPEMWP